MPYSRRMPELKHDPNIDEKINPTEKPDAPKKANPEDVHEGAKDTQVGDRGGPGVGYDQGPRRSRTRAASRRAPASAAPQWRA